MKVRPALGSIAGGVLARRLGGEAGNKERKVVMARECVVGIGGTWGGAPCARGLF